MTTDQATELEAKVQALQYRVRRSLPQGDDTHHDKSFIDDAWEGEKGDLSKTDIDPA